MPTANEAHTEPALYAASSRPPAITQVGGEREVRLALDRQHVADRPVEAEPRDVGELRRLGEARVIAAEREHELALAEPDHEGEAAGQPAGAG